MSVLKYLETILLAPYGEREMYITLCEDIMQSDTMPAIRYFPSSWDPEKTAKELVEFAKSENHEAYAYIGNTVMWAKPSSIPAELVATYGVEKHSREEWHAERRHNPDRRSAPRDDGHDRRHPHTSSISLEAQLPPELSA